MELNKEAWEEVYEAANEVVIAVGYSGSIESDHPAVMNLMQALIGVDDGVFDTEAVFGKDGAA